MSNVTRLQPVQAEYAPTSDHLWTRRASRFFRYMWMLGDTGNAQSWRGCNAAGSKEAHAIHVGAL